MYNRRKIEDGVMLQFIRKSIFYVRHFMLDKNAVTREK